MTRSIYSEWTEREFVIELQKHRKVAETAFYNYCRVYYDGCAYMMFPGAHKEIDFFEDVFMTLWTEITSGKIRVVEGLLCRRDDNGDIRQMNSTLRTFLIGIGRNKYREWARRNARKDMPVEDETVMQALGKLVADIPETDRTVKQEIVATCIDETPESCRRILTAFYYENKSLDEIFAESGRYANKDSLKTNKHKCMKSLTNRVKLCFQKYNLTFSSR